METGPLSIHRLLAGMKKHDASDLHIKVGVPPVYRIGGLLKALAAEPLTEEEADHLMDPIVPEALKKRFESGGNLDFATHLKDGDRFRINMFRAGNHTHAAIRRVKAEIPSYEALHLPAVYSQIIETCMEGPVVFIGEMRDHDTVLVACRHRLHLNHQLCSPGGGRNRAAHD